MVKIGDKVRFLNSVGGGIVKKFINKDIVSVEEEDGFETPVLIKECVIISTAGEMKNIKGSNIQLNVEVDLEKPVQSVELKGGGKLNLLLGYTKDDLRSLDSGKYDSYIINDSNYLVMFTYLSKSGNMWKVSYAGVAEPNMKHHLDCFDKNDLNDIERICVQYVAFKKEKPFEKIISGDVELKIDTVKFFKLHCFVSNPYFEEHAIVYPVCKDDNPLGSVKVIKEDLEDALNEKKKIDIIKARKPINKIKEKNGIIEVDLHINELLDSTTGMSNRDILDRKSVV